MGDPERDSGIPRAQSESVDKCNGATTGERKATEQEPTVNVAAEQQTKTPSKSVEINSAPSEVNVAGPPPTKSVSTPSKVKEHKSGDYSPRSAQKGNAARSSGSDSSRATAVNTHGIPMPTLTSTDTGAISSASNNTPDCNDTPTIESLSTAPDHQSRQSKNEAILYDDSQQTSRAQMVVTVPQQQTVYYQIPQLPSVVTLPVEASEDGIDQQEPIEQQQIDCANQSQIAISQSHLPIHSEDQIIGMVGAIPIIKMEGHYVKEKKGRFSLLQTTPVMPDVVGVTPTTTSTSSQIQGDEPQNNTVAPISNSASSRSQSPAPVVTTDNSVQTGPQTFDKSAPTVKRKGRFVVTNVKDPGSIIQIQSKSTPAAVVIAASDGNATVSQQEEQSQQQHQEQQQVQPQQQQRQPVQQQVPQQIQQQVQQPVLQQLQQPVLQKIQQPVHQQVQPQVQQLPPKSSYHQMSPLQTPIQNPTIPVVHQTFQQPNVSQIPLQPVVIQPVSTIQQTYEIPQPYQQNYAQQTVPTVPNNHQQYSQVPVHHYQQNMQPTTIQYASVHPPNQQNYVHYVPQVQHTVYSSNGSTPTHSRSQSLSFALPPEQQVFYNQQPQEQVPKQQYSPRLSHAENQQINPSSSFSLSQQTVSQPTPPTTPGGSASSPMHSRPVATSILPNAPIPKPTTTSVTEKQQPTKPVTKKKTSIQGRSGKIPQSIDTSGAVSSIGLGKVFYLLDQMKTEVTDADQNIKTLRTDMKILRDKIKELEGKNKDLDAKLRDEQALREKSEIRNMDLRKKLREAKDEIKTLKLPPKLTKDENDGSRHSTESAAKKLDNGNHVGKDAKQAVAAKLPQNAKTVINSGMVSGASPKRNAPSGDGIMKSASSQSHANMSPLSSSKSTPKVKGSNTTSTLIPPKLDLNLKEQQEIKTANDATGRMMRTRGAVKEAEPRSRTSTMEGSVGPRSVKEKPEGSHRRIESMSALGTPPLVPPLRSQSNGAKASGHKHTQSLHDFDPLKSTVPVISFPTPLSLETLPLKTSPTSESVALPQYVAQNSVVMPVSFGMAPTAVRTSNEGFGQPSSERQTLVANNYQGLHEQQYMVVPPQPQIVFNQMTYPSQQSSNTLQKHQYAGRSLQQQNVQQQPLRGHLQQQSPQQQQYSSQQTYATSGNPFDPFSS